MASKFTIGVVAACGLLALGSGVYYSQRARTSGQSLLALQRDCAQLQAGLRSIAGERGNENRAAAALTTGPARPPAAPGGAAGPAGGENEMLYREMAENPRLRLAYAKYFLADFRLKYGALGQNQGWSTEQVDQLGRLELKMLSDRFDLEQAARLMGKDPADPTLAAMEDRVRAAGRAAEVGVVGQVGLQQMRDYDRSYAAQEIVGRVAAGTFYGAAPLTVAQAGTLTRLLTQASPAFQQGGKLEWDTIDWENVLAQAAGSLPAGQVEALRAIRADWQRKNLADAADTAAIATP